MGSQSSRLLFPASPLPFLLHHAVICRRRHRHRKKKEKVKLFNFRLLQEGMRAYLHCLPAHNSPRLHYTPIQKKETKIYFCSLPARATIFKILSAFCPILISDSPTCRRCGGRRHAIKWEFRLSLGLFFWVEEREVYGEIFKNCFKALDGFKSVERSEVSL